jgi:RimJ/RimL family protein N-acetyltransferase
MGVVVRDMTPGDAVLLAVQLRDDPWCAGWPGPDLSLDAVLVTATVDGAPVGFAVAEPVDAASAALVVWVAPAQRRGGVGAALVAEVSERVAAEGVSVLEAVVDAGNVAMAALAHSCGFVRGGDDGARHWWYRRV